MSDLQCITQWFRDQIGTRESGNNNVIYNTDYYGAPVQGDNYPWCCAFIWDGFYQTGLSALFCGGAKTAYCPFVVEWAKAHGRWFVGEYKPGDLLLFDWNGDGVADHIGFCTAWNGAFAYAIEGNSRDMVAEETRYPVNIMGAYRPEYREASTEIPAVYVVQEGDYLWAIADRIFGNGLRWRDIAKANNLNGDTIYPGQKLVIPGSARETITVTLSIETLQKLRAAAKERGVDIGTVIDESVGG